MKKYALLFIVLSVVLVIFESCKKDEEITCNLDAPGQVTEDMTISFTASKTGDGVINTLTYKTSEGEQTITNPSLPWTLNVDADGGTSISITAQGTVKDGSLTVAFSGESQGSTIEGSDFCSHSND